MSKIPYSTALIIGAGPGISASVGRALATEGVKVGLAARDVEKLSPLATEIGAETFAADATDATAVATLFEHMEAKLGPLDVVLYNAAARLPGSITDLDPNEVQRVIAASTYAAFLVVQQAARRMLPRRSGAILLTGASASIKGYPRSSAFAMGMFGRRGLAQTRANCPRKVFTSHISSSMAESEASGSQSPGEAGQHARPRCNRANLSRRVAAAAECMVVGD